MASGLENIKLVLSFETNKIKNIKKHIFDHFSTSGSSWNFL